MATTWRIVYHWDDETIKKEKREFSLTDEIMELINSWWGWGGWAINWVKVNWQVVNPDQAWYVWLTIPWVINTLSSNSTSDALSAKQWKVLYEYIQALQHVWHFLALWNTATWLPVTNPETSPYTYNTWDYYIVSNVAAAGWTNYKPNGSSYTINVASTTVESWDVQVNDLYFYDWYERRLLDNSWWGSSIAVDSSLSTTSTNPVENRVITNRLNQMALDANTKTFWLTNLQDTTTWQAIRDWVDGGWNAIVYYSWMPYYMTAKSATRITLYSKFIGTQNSPSNQSTGFTEQLMWIDNNNNTITITNTAVWMWAPYLATNQNYATAYTPLYDGSPATKKYVDDKFSAVPVYTAGSNINITSNQISTIRNWYVYVTCNDAATTKDKTGTSAEGNYTPQEWDLVMVHFVNWCSVWWPTIAIDWWSAIPFYIWVDGANAGNMYFGSNNVSKMFIYTNGKLVWDAVKDNNNTYSAWTGLALSNWVFSNTQPWPTVSATAPANPSEWDMWYDTDNDVLKVYNGSSWDEAWWGEAIDLVAWDGIIINSIWSDLPDWYTQLQSISSSGSQYILTWINYVSWHTYEFTHKLFVNSATDASKWTWWNAWGWLMMINQSWIKYSWGWTSSIIGDAWQELEVTISIWNWTSTYDYTIWWTTWSLSRSNTSLASYAGSTPYPLFVSTVNNGWWTIYVGSEMTATYYYFEAKDNGTLVRKMYPAKRNADNAIWMYDVVNNVFYTNNWSWSFVPWPIVPVGWLEISAIPYVWWTDIEVVLWEAKRLPTWYTEVEYVQSDGNCYIDTLVNTAWTDYIENHFQKLWSSSTTCAWFGSWEWNNLIRFCIGSYSSQQLWRPCFFGWYNYTSPIWTLNTNKNVIKFYYAWWTYYQTLNDGGPNTYVPQNIWTNPSITSYMFARHWADWQDTTYDNEWTKIFYHLQKDVNWVNKMELIPCVRDSDDEPGFYDLVNERFLANSWSWTLTAWPEVTYNPANVINYTGEGSNTKTFYLSGTSDLTNAQAAYDWYLAWKNPIIRISGWNYSFILEWDNLEPTYHLGFYWVNGGADNWLSNSYIGINPRLELRYSSDTVTSVVVTSYSANTLFTNVDYSTPYTPQYNGSPATKKYVDDTVWWAISRWTTAPSNPVEWQLWYDTTNDVLKVYDWTNWNAVGGSTDTSNTKTFYLASTSDLTNAQAAYDWYAAGKNPIIVYNNVVYVLYEKTSTYIKFVSLSGGTSDASDWTSYEYLYGLKFNLNSSTVSSIANSNARLTSYYLRTWFNYPTPYTPQYNGSPATKKYVDDKMYSWTTAPSNPTEWQLWYDTTNDVLKVYNWTAWVAVWWWGGWVSIINVEVATAYNTTAKVWTTTAWNYTPTAWDLLMVNFVNWCSVASPTLNIDGSWAKNIRTGNASATTSTLALWSTSNSNIKMLMYYDGTYYRTWSTSNNTYSGMSQSTASTGTSTTSSLISAKVLNDTIKEKAITLAADSPLDVTEIRAWTETQYNALSSKWPTTAYLCVED